MEKSEVPPNWANLVENSREKVTEEDYNLTKMWLFPEVEIGDITMQDTINTTTTRTTARKNTSILVHLAVPFESQLCQTQALLNQQLLWEYLKIMILSHALL